MKVRRMILAPPIMKVVQEDACWVCAAVSDTRLMDPANIRPCVVLPRGEHDDYSICFEHLGQALALFWEGAEGCEHVPGGVVVPSGNIICVKCGVVIG